MSPHLCAVALESLFRKVIEEYTEKKRGEEKEGCGMNWKITTTMPCGEEITIDFGGMGIEHYGACEAAIAACDAISRECKLNKSAQRILFGTAPDFAGGFDDWWEYYTDKGRLKKAKDFAELVALSGCLDEFRE